MSNDCLVFKRCTMLFDSLGIPASYLNPACNYCACKKCHESSPAARKKDGDPVGCCYFALQLDPRLNVQEIFTAWDRAYHGTKMTYVKSIAVNGLLLPGDKVSELERGRVMPGAQQFAFASPDYTYTLSQRYAQSVANSSHNYQFVFEMRFRPKSYQINGVEWMTNVRNACVQIAVLVFENYQPSLIAPIPFLPPLPVTKSIVKKRKLPKLPSTRKRKAERKSTASTGVSPKEKTCEVCGKDLPSTAETTFLNCGHVYHTTCLRSYLNAMTDGKMLSPEERPAVVCVSCAEKIPDDTIKAAFGAQEQAGPKAVVDPKKEKDEEEKKQKEPNKAKFAFSCCNVAVPTDEAKAKLAGSAAFEFDPEKSNYSHLIW